GSMRHSLGMYQPTNISVGSRISAMGVPAVSDWPACARPVETILDRRNDPPLAEMLLHLVKAAPKLLDKWIDRGQLNVGLCDLRLLRNDGFARRSILAQHFHSEGHGGRAHNAAPRRSTASWVAS